MAEGLHWEPECLFSLFNLLQTSQMIPDKLLNLPVCFLSSIMAIALLSLSLHLLHLPHLPLQNLIFLFFLTGWTISSLGPSHFTS